MRSKLKINNFLERLPVFKTWTARDLTQLQLFMEKVSFIRNQVVIKEDMPCLNIYLVLTGDFIYTKKVPDENKKEVNIQKLLGPHDQETINYKE